MNGNPPVLHTSQSTGARVESLGGAGWHLEIPASAKRNYHLAQLDDHDALARKDYRWKPPLRMSLEARVSAPDLPGTWGFGLWNDPFSFLLGREGIVQRFPALPQAAWFFHASAHNYLSFRDDLPAQGFLAASFRSKMIPAFLLAIASPAVLLTLLPLTSPIIRTQLRSQVKEDAANIHTNVTEWHLYTLEWKSDQLNYRLDEVKIFSTHIAPMGPLSLVLWIDNQYLALPPGGRLRYGYLPNPQPAWLEIRDLKLTEIT